MDNCTAGEWAWDQGDAGIDFREPYCTVFVVDDGPIIAEVNDRFSREQGRANARLIAAAKNMRDALRRILSVAEEYEDDEFVADACIEARAALAKAGICNAPEPNLATPLQRPDKEAR